MTTLQILKRARKLIAKGWTQVQLERKEGRKTLYCAMGALEKVTDGSYGGYRDVESALSGDPAIKRFIRREYSTESVHCWSYIKYNEAKGRTQQQMINLFDRTIARLSK